MTGDREENQRCKGKEVIIPTHTEKEKVSQDVAFKCKDSKVAWLFGAIVSRIVLFNFNFTDIKQKRREKYLDAHAIISSLVS